MCRCAVRYVDINVPEIPADSMLKSLYPEDRLGGGHAVAQVVEVLRYRSRIRFPIMSFRFFIDVIITAAL